MPPSLPQPSLAQPVSSYEQGKEDPLFLAELGGLASPPTKPTIPVSCDRRRTDRALFPPSKNAPPHVPLQRQAISILTLNSPPHFPTTLLWPPPSSPPPFFSTQPPTTPKTSVSLPPPRSVLSQQLVRSGHRIELVFIVLPTKFFFLFTFCVFSPLYIFTLAPPTYLSTIPNLNYHRHGGYVALFSAPSKHG